MESSLITDFSVLFKCSRARALFNVSKNEKLLLNVAPLLPIFKRNIRSVSNKTP